MYGTKLNASGSKHKYLWVRIGLSIIPFLPGPSHNQPYVSSHKPDSYKIVTDYN